MSKALLCIIGGLLILGFGVYLLLLREKLDYVNDELKQKQKDMEMISKQLDIVNMKLRSIEKPLVLVNKYSNRFISFLKKYQK